MTDYKAIFDRIYASKLGGYGSGGGSSEPSAWPYCRLIERLIADYNPGIVLDLGCGDGHLASKINWGSAHYIGMDVCAEAVGMHRQHGVRGSTLLTGDMLREELPAADLVLTKEATQHMDLDSITLLIEKLRKYRRVIHTTIRHAYTNSDLPAGDCRTVDLSLPPFGLPTTRHLLTWQCGNGGTYTTQMWEPS